MRQQGLPPRNVLVADTLELSRFSHPPGRVRVNASVIPLIEKDDSTTKPRCFTRQFFRAVLGPRMLYQSCSRIDDFPVAFKVSG